MCPVPKRSNVRIIAIEQLANWAAVSRSAKRSLLARFSRAAQPLSSLLSGVQQPRPWPDGEAVDDPSRHFATVNYRSAKGSLDHLVGGSK